MTEGLKLNLGCGANHRDGYVNVDKYGDPDIVCDLEVFPWPWKDNSVCEISMTHVLEHLGETAMTFLGIMKELYRVCMPDAIIKIVVPHPRHDSFLGDPTHVRPIIPAVFDLFSKKKNSEWKKQRASNTLLALYHDIDFEIVQQVVMLDEPWLALLKEGKITEAQAKEVLTKFNNVATEVHITLKALKV